EVLRRTQVLGDNETGYGAPVLRRHPTTRQQLLDSLLRWFLEATGDKCFEGIDILPAAMLGVEVRLARETADQLLPPAAHASMRDKQPVAPNLLAVDGPALERGFGNVMIV